MDKKDFLELVVSNSILRMFVPSIQVRQFIACQFALESDFGTSNLAKIHNNFSGMKCPKIRVRYDIGNYNGFCVYYNLDYCVVDYIARLLYFCPKDRAVYDLDTFKDFLRKSNYCPEKDYISRIELIYNQFFNSKN